MAEFDLVVRGGTLLDGTGAPGRLADVAVSGGRIAEVGRIDARGTREIEADGALVLPGFVDIHTHYDGQALWDSSLAPSVWHGVTTVVMGNCGVGFAPVRPDDHDRLIELMEGVEDIPGTALHEGLDWSWESFGSYLDALDRRPRDVDIATQVPHGPLRLHVMGERGANRETATAADIAAMAALAAEAVRAGALGFTTSRTVNHKSSRGEHTPSLTAAAEELVGIAAALGALGTGVLQVISDFDDPAAEFAILRAMAATSGRPLSVSLMQSHVAPDTWRDILSRIDEANAAGIVMRAQVGARGIGVILGLSCRLHPFAACPSFAVLGTRSPAEISVRMADPELRGRVLAEAAAMPPSLLTNYEAIYELADPPDYEPEPSTRRGRRAAREGRTPAELAWDLLQSGEGRALLYAPVMNYSAGNLDAVGEMLAHPHTVPGLSDGGAHVGTISDASFPTTLLAHWGRDRPRGRLELPLLVARQCRATAEAVGLLDRGVIAPGYRADLNVVDPATVRVRRPEMVADLPAGGHRLLQRADGYLHTFVAGEETYADGQATGVRPGRLIRGAQPTPARR
jgi:N-acyl-D-aspartate/D-glutamate deacylase